jgi:monovalent cation:H+ antiporter-2, CPA2 family
VPHEVSLISTVAVGLAFAFAGGFAAIRLGLPPIVGYLLAGVAIGPFTPGFVADTHLAPQLAEIGVMLLMFGVGMHFSIRDLVAVYRIAVPGAAVQIAAATLLGIGTSWFWGWTLGAGLVFGLALSVASTVVLLRALEGRGMIGSPDGRIAVGWLIVEDLFMVVALVVLPAIAGALGGPVGGSESGSGGGAASAGDLALPLALAFGKVAGFVALMLIVGKRVLPWLLDQVVRTGSRELFTLAVIAAALGIAFASAELFGVSFALGAFFAGIVVNESDHSHRAAEQAKPLEDAFAVLFFLSVGMLFDPGILLRHPFQVLAVLAIILLGKSLAAFAIVRAAGYGAATALTVSASLAQIGEFSFMLAALGTSRGLLAAEGRNLILAGALLSITLNPAAFSLAAALRRRLERSQPA